MGNQCGCGLWPWKKGVWANSEQLFWVFFSILHGQKEIFFEFFLHCSVRTEKLHKIKLKFDFPYHEISGPDICSLICAEGHP